MKFCAVASVVFLALLSAVGARAETTEKRLALVVGIGAYEYATALPNPPNDARAMGDAFIDLGFEVYSVLDPDKRGLETALRDFSRKASEADLVVIFFAGHGLQVNGRNYLVPIDAKLEDPRDLPYDAVPLELFLGAVSEAKLAGITIVDACRDNPFVDRLSARADASTEVKAGMSRIDDVPGRALIAMATRANGVAEDGAGEHSPYTTALLDQLKEPGVELRLFFGKVADKVKEMTKNRQEPYVAGTLGGTPVYLNPVPPNQMPVATRGLVVKVLDNSGPTLLGIPAPTDPDKTDRLVVRITSLPAGGQVKLFDRVVLIGDLLTAEQLKQAAFQPDGVTVGDVGKLEYQVTDDRGGSDIGSVAVFIQQSNKPPVVAAAATVQAVRNPLGLQPPTDPDGDTLTITVTAVPSKGAIHDGPTILAKGDRIDVAALSRLTYDPEDAAPGAAGSFGYTVDDGQGGSTEASVRIEIVEGSTTASQVAAVSGPTAVPDTVRGIALEPAMGRYIALSDANVRDGPSPSAKRIDRIAKGTEVQVLGKAEGANWYSVTTAGGDVGFIASELLRPVEPEIAATPESVEVAPAAAPEPAEAAPEVAMVPPDAPAAPANEFADCDGCPVMVALPAGEFIMGNAEGDGSERPPHRVEIKPFAMGKFEVTVAQWRACVEAAGCESISQMNSADDTIPMLNVSWDDASAYVKWLADKSGKKYRLPTEAEWEYAARAGTKTPYWWGDKLSPEYASCRDCGGEYAKLTPPSAATLMANPFGLVSMGGGISEWVMDCWRSNYEGAATDGSAWTEGNCSRRVLRGGSWRDDHKHITASARAFYDHDVRYLYNGFRVALDTE
ncbi:MAG TPA: SUMF1/EgtB/PvdO family nonheme iron enzyme [Dongiaceae bacterium]